MVFSTYIHTVFSTFKSMSAIDYQPSGENLTKSHLREPECVQNIHCSGTILINTNLTGAVPGDSR